MKYIKTFEKKFKEIVLYKCDAFNILINSNDSFTFNSRVVSKSGIMAMADLIREKSKYLNDKNLRDVKIDERYINYEINHMNLDEMNRRANIREYRSGSIGDFLEYKGKDKISRDVWMELTEKYNPIIIDAISKSKTLGDIIDFFTEIYNDIIVDLELFTSTNKYNL